MSNPRSGSDAPSDDVILKRECWIEGPGGEASPLTLSFTRPRRDDDGTVTAALHMTCRYFDRKQKIHGVDDLQALSLLLAIGPTLLRNIEEDGYSIWHLERGDLSAFDFWTGKAFEPAFQLPSAYADARREAFYQANAGKRLTPSHRVGIEPDRPAITIYKVNDDGSDRLGCVIGPEEMQGHTWQSLAQVLGERILWDSREGIELMRALQPDRGPDPDDQPTNARSST